MGIFRKKLPEKEWEEMNNTVLSVIKSRDLEKALTYAHNLYNITKKEYGSNHANSVTAINNLGFIYLMRKEFLKAESYLLLALETAEKVYGKYSKETALINANLSQLYISKTKEAYEIDAKTNNRFRENDKELHKLPYAGKCKEAIS